MIGPSQPVMVNIGDDIILPCHLKPAVDAVGMTLEWARLDLKPRFVHVWHEGQNLQDDQHLSYKGRTSLSIDKLKQGDVSLKLSRVKLSDNGQYRCFFPDLDKASTVRLVVGKCATVHVFVPVFKGKGFTVQNYCMLLQLLLFTQISTQSSTAAALLVLTFLKRLFDFSQRKGLVLNTQPCISQGFPVEFLTSSGAMEQLVMSGSLFCFSEAHEDTHLDINGFF